METTHGFKWEKTFGAVSAPKCLISVQQHNISLLSLGVFSYFPSLTSRSGVDAAQQVLPRTRAVRCAAWLAFSWLNEAKSSLGNRLTLRERERKRNIQEKKKKNGRSSQSEEPREKGMNITRSAAIIKLLRSFGTGPKGLVKSELDDRQCSLAENGCVCVCVCNTPSLLPNKSNNHRQRDRSRNKRLLKEREKMKLRHVQGFLLQEKKKKNIFFSSPQCDANIWKQSPSLSIYFCSLDCCCFL